MASAFAHALVGASVAFVFRAHIPQGSSPRQRSSPTSLDELELGLLESREKKLLKWSPLLSALVAAAPDLDVVMHAFVRYEDSFGHRGAFHSPVFYLFCACAVAAYCRAKLSQRLALWLSALVFVSLISHSILDMLTTGGLGIAMLWPISSERFFLPWQVIPVSPLSVDAFFGEWGKRVLVSELRWALPGFILSLLYERVFGRLTHHPNK